VEAHQGLIHAADLLDVERAIRQPLVVEVEELFQHAIDGFVVDAGHLHTGPGSGIDRRTASGRPAFKEGVAFGVEQIAATGGQDHGTVLGALRTRCGTGPPGRGQAPNRRNHGVGELALSSCSCSGQARTE